jgi:hypothetical protein
MGPLFSPHSLQTHSIAAVFSIVLVIAAFVFLVVAVGVFYSVVRYRASGDPAPEPRQIFGSRNLEAELADSKIADRACALLEAGSLDFNPIDAISRSVASIIRPFQLGTVLNQPVRDLEQDLAEYELVRQAKAILQTRDRMSEEQAYVYLRNASRSPRRRLGHVAREVIRKGPIKRADIRPLRLAAAGSG